MPVPERTARPGVPGGAFCPLLRGPAARPPPAAGFPGRLGLLADPGQLGPGGVKVTLGALGAAAQLAARLLEHLGAGFQRGAQVLPLACRVGADLRELGRVRRRHLGQPPGGVGEPGQDLVPFPLGVAAQLLNLACGVFTGPRRLCAGVIGAGLGGGGALAVLRGLRERLVPGVTGGPDEALGLGLGLRDRLPRQRLGAARALPGRGDALGLVRLRPARSRCPGLPRRG